MSEDLIVPEEFIEENQEIVLPKSPRKGGPYSKNDRRQRQSEVSKLHFDYGYSARQIAEIMKVNRHTIDNDINQLYTQLSREWECYDIGSWYMKQIQRLESQRTRLYKQLEKQKNPSARLPIEKMILDIDSRIMQMIIKIDSSKESWLDRGVNQLNKWTKDHKLDLSFVHSRDITKTSTKTQEKIQRLINEDYKNRRGRF